MRAQALGVRNTDAGWGWPARLLHWVMAGLILFQLGLGVWMVRVVSDIYQQFWLFQTHKSWGFVIFALALARVIWGLANRVPEPPEGAGPVQETLARGAHLALYLLMLALPLSGWLVASASASPLQDSYGLKTLVFTWFELPDAFQPGAQDLEDFWKSIHAWAAFGLAVLLAGHAAAALWHHFRCRDTVLRRMILGR